MTPEGRTMSGLSRHKVRILHKVRENQDITELMAVIGRKNRTKFRDQVLNPLIDNGLVEMTIPDELGLSDLFLSGLNSRGRGVGA